MQTRAEPVVLNGLVTADEAAFAQTTFSAAQAPERVGPQLQATLNLIPAHTWYANASGALTFLNERGSDYLGLPKDHPLRLGIRTGAAWDSHIALLHPDDREETRRVWSTCLRTGSAGQVSVRIRNAEGGYRWFLSRAEPVRASDGTLLYWIGINFDIEDRKQAEFYLAEGQRLAHMGSWVFNAAGFDYWSPELFRIYGLDPSGEAPAVDEYMELVHPEDRQFVAQTIQKAFAEGRGFDFTKRIVRPDGEIRRVRCVGVPVTHDGTFHGTGIDVTEQEQLTEELRRSEVYLAEGQRLGRAGSWSFKPDLTCDYWSRELYEILGFDPKNGIPTISNYFTRIHPEDRPVVEATIRRMIAAGDGCDLKKRIIRPDGVQRVIRCVGKAVRENGVVTRFVGTLMDITEQEELTQELRRREAYLAEAQRLSHTGSFGWKISTREVIWSDETFRIFQYDRTLRPSVELVLQRVHPEDAAQVKETIERAAQDGRDFDFEHRLLMPDGSVKHVHLMARASIDDLGSIEFVGAVTDVTAAKQVEDRIRLIINTVPGLHWSARPDGWVNFINQRWLDYTGMTLEQALGWGWAPAYHPDELERVLIAWRAAVAEGKPLEMETRLRRFDGEYRWFLERVFPLFDSAGHILGWYGSDIDIQDKKQAEEKLRQSEAYLAEAQKLSHTGSWAWSPDTDVRYWSEECYRVLGFDPRDGLPRIEELIQRVHPDDRAAFRESVRRATHGELDEEVDYRIVHPGGAVRDIHSAGHPIFNASGDLVEYTGTVIDVTEHKRAEEAVRRSKAFLAEGQRLSHTGSWGWNASTGKLTWSKEHFRILGLEPEDTNPSLDVFWERVHPDDRTGLRRAFESAIQDKRDFEQEFRIVRPDSSIRHLHGVGHAVLNKANELVEFMGSTMDITERKQAEAALQEARGELERVARVTAMGELTASIAHEINQPLAGVVTSANAGLNWLAANPPNLPKTRETLERILRDGTRGGEILARIRALLKRTPPAKILVSLNQVVRDVLALTSGELRQHGIELTLKLNSNLPAIRGDGIQLQQVLLNLIKNAIEAMAAIPNGQRTLGIQSCPGELDGKPAVVVEVSDNGVGFSGTDSSRFFEAFHTTKPQGMGMGLWISRSIIENHHGRLAASPNGGPGATFLMMLPKGS